MSADDPGKYTAEYRDLSGWTKVLTAISITCLLLHLARALLSIGGALNVGSSSIGSTIDFTLKGLFLGSAIVGLAWLYRANLNAHALSRHMKHSPLAAVIWFFAPALNILFSMSVVYEIWSQSGGNKREKILIIWWALTVLSIYIGTLWMFSDRTPLLIQSILAGSTLSFLIIARRIDAFQSLAAAAAEFGEPVDSDQEVLVADDRLRPQPYAHPHTSIENVEQLRSIESSNGAVNPPSIRIPPAVADRPPAIVLQRPKSSSDPSSKA